MLKEVNATIICQQNTAKTIAEKETGCYCLKRMDLALWEDVSDRLREAEGTKQ